jgi:hypothetical protein
VTAFKNPPARAGRSIGTATSSAAPERARWPRLAAAPQPGLRSMLPRGYVGFTEATTPRQLVLPATTFVPLVVKLLDSAHRPPAFVMGARGRHWSWRVTAPPRIWRWCCRRWGPIGSWGCPWLSSAASWWTWSRCWGRMVGGWVSSSARPRAGGGALGWWTGFCWGGWRGGRGPRPRSPGLGSGWCPRGGGADRSVGP